jgi:uncharacterized membrane protein
MSEGKPGGGFRLGRTIAPPRFVMFVVLLIGGFFAHRLLVEPRSWTESLVLGFDLAAAAFLASLVPLWREADGAVIREHADANNANRLVVLLVTLLVMIVVMACVAGELSAASKGELAAIVKLVGSLLLVWLFTNSVYSLHYAHDYYSTDPESGGERGGLDFAGDDPPVYSDFIYFAFTLGMTFQTSDTGVTVARVRKVVLLHSLSTYLLNIGVIAFIINTLSGS